MPFAEKKLRGLDARVRYLKELLALGGLKATGNRRRLLSDEEKSSGFVNGRALVDEEKKRGMILLTQLLTPERRSQIEAELTEATKLLQAPSSERVDALVQSTSLGVDRIEEKVDKLLEQNVVTLSDPIESALLEPLSAMPWYMHEPLKTCNLAGTGMRLYATALRSLADDPPAMGHVDVRSMGTVDLGALARHLAIQLPKDFGWQHAENTRCLIANKAATVYGKFALDCFQASLVERNSAFFQQEAANILPPGSLVRARVRKMTTLTMIRVPAAWPDAESCRLAYSALNLEDDCKYVSFAATDVVKVICRTQVPLPVMAPPLKPSDSLSGMIFDQMKQLPGIAADKLKSVAEKLGIEPSAEALVAWGKQYLAKSGCLDLAAVASPPAAQPDANVEVLGLLLS